MQGHPNRWGCPNIKGASKHMEVSKHTGDTLTNAGGYKHEGHQTYGGVKTYRGHPNIWGCPNIQGASKHMVSVQKYRGIQTYGGSKHTGVIQTYGECPNIQGAFQTYGECPNIQGVFLHAFLPAKWVLPLECIYIYIYIYIYMWCV